MIGNILVATDLTERSDLAMQRALALKRQHAAGLVIAHIIDRPLSPLDTERRANAARKAIDARLSTLPPGERENIAIKVTVGTPQWELGQLARANRCDLVLLGRHEYKGGRHLLTGSTMEGLARDGNCSLLVASVGAPAEYRRVVLGIDMSIYARFALSMALKLAPQAALVCVRVLPAADAEAAARAALSEFIADTLGRMLPPEQQEDIASRLELIVRAGEPQAVLFETAREQQADLLAVGMRGRPASMRAGLGGTAQGLLNAPPCDVLAANIW